MECGLIALISEWQLGRSVKEEMSRRIAKNLSLRILFDRPSELLFEKLVLEAVQEAVLGFFGGFSLLDFGSELLNAPPGKSVHGERADFAASHQNFDFQMLAHFHCIFEIPQHLEMLLFFSGNCACPACPRVANNCAKRPGLLGRKGRKRSIP